MARPIGDPDCLRTDVLRLHAMAHTLVNGVPLTTNVENVPIWELADVLESELAELVEGAKRATKLMRPMIKLTPDEQEGNQDKSTRITVLVPNGWAAMSIWPTAGFGAGNRTAAGQVRPVGGPERLQVSRHSVVAVG
jgi:hypothetical protein